MTRRKKSPPSSATQETDAQAALPSPFETARDRMMEVVRRARQDASDAKRKKTPKPPAASAAPDESKPDERSLLAQAYAGVQPLPEKDRNLAGAPKTPAAPRIGRETDSALAALSDFVEGKGDFNIEFLDEFITGLAPGVDFRLLEQLKRGEFSVQGHIDLHGFTWAEAREEILAFVRTAIREQKRCVLIIHGRGLHSKTPTPALRDGLVALLTRGPLRKHILAFSTARPSDGGPGSMYLLLRRGRPAGGIRQERHER